MLLATELQLDSDWQPPGDGDGDGDGEGQGEGDGDGDGGGSSVVTATLRLTFGVTAGSLHAKAHKFFMIFGLGQGSLTIHNSNNLAKALADFV